MARGNLLAEKSHEFALSIVRIIKKSQEDKKEYILSKQLIGSGTSIPTLFSEAKHTESKKGFTHKMAIGLKEANETGYWIDLFYTSEYQAREIYNIINSEITRIIRRLAVIAK